MYVLQPSLKTHIMAIDLNVYIYTRTVNVKRVDLFKSGLQYM